MMTARMTTARSRIVVMDGEQDMTLHARPGFEDAEAAG
jgi:hypothetical protein